MEKLSVLLSCLLMLVSCAEIDDVVADMDIINKLVVEADTGETDTFETDTYETDNAEPIENDSANNNDNDNNTVEDGAVELSREDIIPDGAAEDTKNIEFINSVINTPSIDTNYWGYWFEAVELKENGNYQQAADKFISIANVFLSENDSNSGAMFFKHLGECYSNLGEYTKASACFSKEAEYWSISDGMEQSYIDADRRSKLINADVQLYVKNFNQNLGVSKYFGVKHEPRSGIYLGAYAEGDTNIYDPYDPSRFYMDTFPKLVGQDMTSYIIYLTYGKDISVYDSHVKKAIENNKILQVSLQPLEGLEKVNKYDGYLKKLAKDMEKSGCKMMLRFACEMNEPSSLWYVSDPEYYKEKFRIVADVFHKYAPSVPVIWSVNHYPDNNYQDYYPGDEYVDYVGISSYKELSPQTDPLSMGVDRSRWSNQLDNLYALYGSKKPIIISEGGVSYCEYNTGEDITEFACRQLEDFLTYLPIRYPNVKYFFTFAGNDPPRKFLLSENDRFLETYKKAISNSDAYVYKTGSEAFKYNYYELVNNVCVKAERTQLCSYITTPLNNVSYVEYARDGMVFATAYEIPYTVDINFSEFSIETTDICVTAYDENNKKIVSEEFSVKVK